MHAQTDLNTFTSSPSNTTNAVHHIKTVFVIVMENHNWTGNGPALNIKNNIYAPYINYTLVPNGAHAENYYNPPGVHPSLGNYLWMEAGTDFKINGMALTSLPVKTLTQTTEGHLSYQLYQAGKSWKAYSGKTWPANTCPLQQLGVPQIFFKDVNDGGSLTSAPCIRHVRPLSELAGELAKGTAPDYNFIVPSLCDDMHTACGGTNPIVDGDNWLKANIPTILHSSQYRAGGAIFIVWDEATKGDGPIGSIVMSPFAKQGYQNKIHYTHGSLLRTVEEIFGVPLLNDAAKETDLSDLFSVFP